MWPLSVALGAGGKALLELDERASRRHDAQRVLLDQVLAVTIEQRCEWQREQVAIGHDDQARLGCDHIGKRCDEQRVAAAEQTAGVRAGDGGAECRLVKILIIEKKTKTTGGKRAIRGQALTVAACRALTLSVRRVSSTSCLSDLSC